MTVAVPEPVPLAMPPANVSALDALVVDVACAAYDLAVLSVRLAGPAAAARGWVGDDARAAATQVTRLAALIRDSSTAVLSAAGRLSAHADVLHEARRVIDRLRAEQDEDFRAAWTRLGHMADLEAMFVTNDPQLVALVADLEAAETARRSRHAAVLAEVEDDAAATARALGEDSAVVGGRGAPGDVIRVVAFLSAALPGWGDQELADRGRALGVAMATSFMTPEQRADLAKEAAAFAGRRPFADALLAGLSPAGVRGLLVFLGSNVEAPSGPVARLLAAAFSAAEPTGRPGDPLDEVLAAGYVRADDRYGISDVIGIGMSAVLTAGIVLGRPLRPDTLVSWGRQLMARERVQRMPVGANAAPSADGTQLADPLALVAAALVQAGPEAVIDLLSTPGAWDAMFGRFWTDGGVAVSGLLDQAASVPGERGGAVIRSALVALGAGLADGDPQDWTVSIRTSSAVAPALARSLAAHLEVATEALRVGVDGEVGRGRADVLRGLGYLTLDRTAAAQVERALLAWARVQPGTVDGSGPTGPLAAASISGAYLAVEQYGQRLAYAMHGFEEKLAAEGRQIAWRATIGQVVQAIPGVWGVAAGALEPVAAHLVGADGTWDNGPDRGLVFDRGQAADLALGTAPPASKLSHELARQASGAFDRTLSAMPPPAPPTSPDQDVAGDQEDTIRDFREQMMRAARRFGR